MGDGMTPQKGGLGRCPGRAPPLQKEYSTRTSQVVPHPSTNRAWACLTSQIGRDAVCPDQYGRTHFVLCRDPYMKAVEMDGRGPKPTALNGKEKWRAYRMAIGGKS